MLKENLESDVHMPDDKYYWEYSFDLVDQDLKLYYGKKSYKTDGLTSDRIYGQGL